MHGLSGLLWLQKQNRSFNGWFTASPREYYIEGAENEIAEIKKSLHEKNNDELELEVGDLLWDVLSLINKLDHEGRINIDRVCPRAVAKFAERMPYIVNGELETDMDRRDDTWETVKKLQKMRGIDESHPLVQKVWQSISTENK